MASDTSGSTTPKERSTQLKLSDVIRIVAPENELFNHQLFFIDYLDEEKIHLVNMDSMSILKLRIHEGGVLGDGTIQEIVVVSRAKLEGYARQHDLVVGKWIDVYFDGPTPAVITGEITNLELDMIEVRVYNGQEEVDPEYLYFNFDYKGLPQEVNINRIELRPPIEEEPLPLEEEPSDNIEADRSDDDLDETQEDEIAIDKEDIELEEQDSDLEEGEIREDKPISDVYAKNKTTLGEYIITAKERNLGAYLDAVTTMRKVDESKERYTLTAQTEDLLDDLIMKQEEGRKGFRSTNNLAIEIERFTQLRETFSLMDKYFNVTGVKLNTDNWKPAVDDILHMQYNLRWVVPVTKAVQNMYDVNIPADEEISDVHNFNFMSDLDTVLRTTMEGYTNGTDSDVINKYRQYMMGLNRFFSPFDEPSVEDTDIISMVTSPIDQYAIMNNFNNFSSSCVSNAKGSNITTTRMNKHQYLSPTKLPVTRDPNMSKIERTQLTSVDSGDAMAIRSIMTLPYSIAQFSIIDRPTSSIDKKCHNSTLFSTYFKTLGRKTKIHNVLIDNDTTTSKYNNHTYHNFTNYHLGSDMKNIQFNDYLDSIIPTTQQLIDMVAHHATDKLSFHDFMSVLGPYSIYSNDITNTHYASIQKYVNKNISRFLDDKKGRWKILGRINGMKHSNQLSTKAIIDIINENDRQYIESQYNQSGLNYSNSELLSKMIHLDYGMSLTDVISRNSTAILVHDKVDLMLDIFRGDDNTKQGKQDEKATTDNANDKCKMVVISKQYFTEKELQEDNKTIVYFDKKYDDTLYSMLTKPNESYSTTVEKFDAEYTQMTPENFFMFIRKKVRGLRPNSVSDQEVDYLAETLITGKKRVSDGDYALLHDNTSGSVLYFKRVNNSWKMDQDMTNHLPTDNAALNCSLEPDCVYNDINDKCESISDSKSAMHENILKEIINRFDEKLTSSAEELQKYLADRVQRSNHIIKVLKSRRTQEICKYDLQQYKIGAELIASGETQVTPRSPHLELKDKILAQKDLTMKYSDLIHFINRYTEECVDSDKCNLNGGYGHRWRYCKETKTKLIPVFLHELALAWMDDTHDYSRPTYQHTLQRIIREIGAESDDGAYWVDKHSGITISRKDFDTDEGFENGRKIVSRAVAEEDFESRYMREVRQAHATVVKYITPETKIMFRISSAVAGFMNISLSSQMEFIVKLASSTLMTRGILPTEAEYKRSIAAKSKDGHKSRPYETIYNETIMFLTLGAILIGIQTSIPSVVTKKTYPGCVRSFSGFPFDGDGDTSGLAYIACVARKGTTTTGVWSVIRRKSPENIMKSVRGFIENYYLTNTEVVSKIHTKREYLLEHPEDTIPDENRVEQWKTFIPPLRTIRLPRLEPIANGFRELLISDIKMGSSAQWSKIDVIQGKIIQFSLAFQLGIQQTIDEIKNHREGIDELFLDEFGSESLGKTQFEYFSKLNGDIPRSEAVIHGLQSTISDVKRLSRGHTIYCDINDKNARASLTTGYSEVTIYRAFISICRFNRQDILDDNLSNICGGKPDNFSSSDPILEKIRKLKDAGKVYDETYLYKLLRTSGEKNQIIPQYDKGIVTQVQRLRNVISQYSDELSDKQDHMAEIMRHLDIVLDTFDYDTYRSSPEVRTLRNALSKHNEHMRNTISTFILDHMAIAPAHVRSMNTLLNSLSSWQEDDSEFDDKSSVYYNLFAFINTYIQNMAIVFPSIIRHKILHNNTTNYSTAKRNNWSRKAIDAINNSVEREYITLEEFYNEQSIVNILDNIEKECKIVMKMAEHTPYFTEIPQSKDNKHAPIVSVLDKTTCKMLFEYYILTTMNTYIELSNDDRLLNLDSEKSEYTTEDLAQRIESDIPSIDPSIYMNDMNNMKRNTAKLLYQYVDIMHKHKDIVQQSYFSIMDTNFKIREGEKALITGRLESMAEQADRDLDNIMKANKQGVWSKGLQKSLRFHVKESYDDEREFMDTMQEVENHIRNTNRNVTDENFVQYQDDYLDDMEHLEHENEERDISRVRGDDADGDPYGDEYEDEDF
jgi:hypothetical protein